MFGKRRSTRPGDGRVSLEQLQKREEELTKAGRYRTALDEILHYLRHDPSNEIALNLAKTVLAPGRTATVQSAEPITSDQAMSALLAPLMTQCSQCRTRWSSIHAFPFMAAYPETNIVDPAGIQCQTCRYTLCSDCFPIRSRPGSVRDVEERCPVRGCDGRMTTPVLATGISDVIKVDPNDIERVIVVRGGPIAPAMDEVLKIVTRFIPLWHDDTDLISICRDRSASMNAQRTRVGLAAYLVHGLERDGTLAPGAWQRATHLTIRDGHGGDADYLLVLIRSAGPGHSREVEREIAGLINSHVRKMRRLVRRAGACWAGIDADAMIAGTAELLHQASAEGRRTDAIAVTRTGAIPGYGIAGTVVSDPDGDFTPHSEAAFAAFPDGYGDFAMSLLREFREPGDELPNLNFVHWVLVHDRTARRLHATVLPADKTESPLFAVDLMTQNERRGLGL